MHSSGFNDFILKPEIRRSIADAGFEHPSEGKIFQWSSQSSSFSPSVQNECIPNAILGNDVLCQAKSGMGKTAVFVIAILQQLPKKPDPVSALILCHTRELAYQINKEFVRLGKFMEVKSKVFYGGEPITDQQKVLKNEPPHVVVGTPGRILDLIQKGFLKLENLRYFVLDECDKMLEQLGKFHFNIL